SVVVVVLLDGGIGSGIAGSWDADNAGPVRCGNCVEDEAATGPALRRRRSRSAFDDVVVVVVAVVAGLYGLYRGSGYWSSLRSFSFPSGTRFAKTTRMVPYR